MSYNDSRSVKKVYQKSNEKLFKAYLDFSRRPHPKLSTFGVKFPDVNKSTSGRSEGKFLTFSVLLLDLQHERRLQQKRKTCFFIIPLLSEKEKKSDPLSAVVK
ncbi:hypothetical protein BSK20_02755 [SR1 bacterium human oral taxon HOT-345]|nr:hypothetical protein BSK20_02755 [SR1 bacterium human oral taxon HOT-345]